LQALTRMLVCSQHLVSALVLLRLAALAELAPHAMAPGKGAGAPVPQREEGQDQPAPAVRMSHAYTDVMEPLHSGINSMLEGAEQLAVAVGRHVSEPNTASAAQLRGQLDAVRQLRQATQDRLRELVAARKDAVRGGAVPAEASATGSLEGGAPAPAETVAEAASMQHVAGIAYVGMCWALLRSVDCVVSIGELAVGYKGVVGWSWRRHSH
jgi:hypothetical protein